MVGEARFDHRNAIKCVFVIMLEHCNGILAILLPQLRDGALKNGHYVQYVIGKVRSKYVTTHMQQYSSSMHI